MILCYLGFNQQGLIWYVFAINVCCIADVLTIRQSRLRVVENGSLNRGVLIHAD